MAYTVALPASPPLTTRLTIPNRLPCDQSHVREWSGISAWTLPLSQQRGTTRLSARRTTFSSHHERAISISHLAETTRLRQTASSAVCPIPGDSPLLTPNQSDPPNHSTPTNKSAPTNSSDPSKPASDGNFVSARSTMVDREWPKRRNAGTPSSYGRPGSVCCALRSFFRRDLWLQRPAVEQPVRCRRRYSRCVYTGYREVAPVARARSSASMAVHHCPARVFRPNEAAESIHGY